MEGLSKNQLEIYERDGVVGPIRLTSNGNAAKIKAQLAVVNDDLSPIYGVPTNRDRHLHVRDLYDLATSESVINTVKSILGDDIVLFRSDCFKKIPSIKGVGNVNTGGGNKAQGAYETKFEYLDWHYGANFATFEAPSVGRRMHQDENPIEYFASIPTCVTVWFALSPSTPENGAVEYWKASHKLGPFDFVECEQGKGIGGSNFRMDINPTAEDCATFTVQPGEALVFNNRIVHRSKSNWTDNTRYGIGLRYTKSSALIYDNLDTDPYGLPLEKWGVIPVSGKVLNKRLPIAKPIFSEIPI